MESLDGINYGIVDWSTFAYRYFSHWADKTADGDKNFSNCLSKDPEYIAENLYDEIINNIKLLKKDGYNIDPCVICFDSTGSEARKAMFSDYKANRKPLFNEEMDKLKIEVFHHLKELAKKYLYSEEWIYLEAAGYEADDLIYVCVKDLIKAGNKIILSNDRDLYQLIDPHTSMLVQSKGEIKEINFNNFSETSGVQGCPPYKTPNDFLMGKILQGDSSDNISGYEKIGKKKAFTLVNRYKTFKNIIKNKVVDSDFVCNGVEQAAEKIRKAGSEIFIRNTKLIHIGYVAKNKYLVELLIEQFNSQIQRLPS